MIARIALRFTAWAERWLPDAFVFALLATLVVFVAGLAVAHAAPGGLVTSWGHGFWELVPFTMQMALIIVTGYVLASSRPVALAIAALARLPRTRAASDGHRRALLDDRGVVQLGLLAHLRRAARARDGAAAAGGRLPGARRRRASSGWGACGRRG